MSYSCVHPRVCFILVFISEFVYILTFQMHRLHPFSGLWQLSNKVSVITNIHIIFL